MVWYYMRVFCICVFLIYDKEFSATCAGAQDE